MELSFYKYQGTGNDFVMIDDRDSNFDEKNLDLVRSLCDRKFGIGADGLILIRNHPDFDFEMIYFNADGSQSMCGNGARCAVAFSAFLGIIQIKTSFLAIDGPHEAILKDGLVELLMGNVSGITEKGDEYFVNTGSPHHIRFVDQIKNYPVFEEGKSVRYDQGYSPAGTNVNFLEENSPNEVFVRTYERGVENETLSCGTGVTAAALVFGTQKNINHVKIKTLGGNLSVKFKQNDQGQFQDIWLIGPAEQVFSGKISV
ncbi:diaminopimelate epimerase [Algoriphagus boseongensis]|uniref:Diaminopimelate epimerase n=1 Tax=Algoriphagus boseongensis TaxID=1442587 RepID=A0A4R6T608_9BACT|nr:diaminopimelate epimerase [Algoriphagus boseongensis]TDQ17092.1 diaminopimelate epimerase [Algoriphagus boseongensis]